MARVRRALWHHKHDGQQQVDGVYPDWTPTPVNINLLAGEPEWKAAVLAKDPPLWEEILRFRAEQLDHGVVGRFLKKRPHKVTALRAWVDEGDALFATLQADVARLGRWLEVARADLPAVAGPSGSA